MRTGRLQYPMHSMKLHVWHICTPYDPLFHPNVLGFLYASPASGIMGYRPTAAPACSQKINLPRRQELPGRRAVWMMMGESTPF